MSSNKEQNRLESAHDAALGYATVILATVCFLIALAVIIVGVRFVVGLSPNPSTTVTQTTATTVVGTRS